MAKTDNPWSVNKLEEFLHYCCPECEHKYQSKETFVLHAFEKHPRAKEYIELRLDSNTVTVFCKNQPEPSSPFKLQECVIEDVVIINNAATHDTDNENFDQAILMKNHNSSEKEYGGTKMNTENEILSESVTFDDTINVTPQKNQSTWNFSNKPKTFDYSLLTASEKEIVLAQTTCNLCNKTLVDPRSLARHIKTVHETIKDYNCDQCEKGFTKKSLYESHVTRAHKPVQSTKKLKKRKFGKVSQRALKNQDKLEIDYDLFDNPFLDKRNSKENMTGIEEMQIYKCDLCGKTFNQSSNLSKHIFIMHDIGEEYRCEYCDNKFRTKSMLSKHIISDHSETIQKTFTCNVCNQTFLSSKSLLFHTRKYHDSSMKCEHCEKSFGKLSDKKRHVSVIHEGNKPLKLHKCNECDKTFSRNYELSRHINSVHLGIRPYQCDLCNKSYSKSTDLNNHIKYFHEQKQRDPQKQAESVTCKFCSKVFAKPENLRKHIECVHHGIRPIVKCELCGKIYESHQGLETHVKRVHQGIKEEKIHKCNFCDQAFTRVGTMRRHMETIHLTPTVPPSRKLKTVINPHY